MPDAIAARRKVQYHRAMPTTARHVVEWPDLKLRVFEPTAAELAASAPGLAAYYNDAHNRTMMAHSSEMSAQEVAEHFETLWCELGRPFILEREGVLMGDADLRRIEGRTAEFAIMVGARAEQGKGLGQRFAIMIHALAFERLGIDQIFVSIIPANAASRRLFEKLGYLGDNSAEARAYADEDDDITMSVHRARFVEVNGAAMAQQRFLSR